MEEGKEEEKEKSGRREQENRKEKNEGSGKSVKKASLRSFVRKFRRQSAGGSPGAKYSRKVFTVLPRGYAKVWKLRKHIFPNLPPLSVSLMDGDIMGTSRFPPPHPTSWRDECRDPFPRASKLLVALRQSSCSHT